MVLGLDLDERALPLFRIRFHLIRLLHSGRTFLRPRSSELILLHIQSRNHLHLRAEQVQSVGGTGSHSQTNQQQ